MERDIRIDEIFSDEEFNCRGHITPASVAELSTDIEKNGLIQAIVVQPYDAPPYKWRIVVGHRRHLASKLWNKRGGPDTIRCSISEPLPEHRAMVVNIKENLNRCNLNMMEEARAIEKFLRWGWTPMRVAEELGVAKRWAEVRFGLLNLSEHIQRRAEAGFLTQGQVEDILRISSDAERVAYVKKCVDHKLHGEKIKVKKPNNAKKRAKLSETGVPRDLEEIFEEQERVQDCFRNNAHPIAVALGWAAGVISTEDFYKHMERVAQEQGRVFKRPPKVA